MARIIEPTPQQEAFYHEWLASRPPRVRVVAARFEPWSLYRLKSTGHRCTIVSFGEHAQDDGVSLTVAVTGQYNAVAFDRHVFGINPDDLEPCELPRPDEPIGTALTPEEVHDNIEALRSFMKKES